MWDCGNLSFSGFKAEIKLSFEKIENSHFG
jgi:hypothetical protein